MLGWSPGDDREIMTIDELINSFSLKGIQKKDAIFDESKLFWMNGHHIRQTSNEAILKYVKQELSDREIICPENYLIKVIKLLKPRAKVLNDFIETGNYFYEDPKKFDHKGIKKYLTNTDIWKYLIEFTQRLKSLANFDEETIETLLREYAEEEGISSAKIIHPVRLAISGKTATPGLFEMMVVLGKETTLRRLDTLLKKKHELLTFNSDMNMKDSE